MSESIEAILAHHFSYNMYPPAPELIPAALEAVQAMRDGNPEKEVDVTFMFPMWSKVSGGTKAYMSAWEFVEDFKLEHFVEVRDEGN